MRYVVTGAAGNLGSRLCASLVEQGHSVVAADRMPKHKIPVKLRIVDLLDRYAVCGLMEDGVDAVVHLGNHPDFSPPDPQLIFNENVNMNQNVFQAAADAGAERIVFASSIQVFASVPAHHKHVADELPAYLPLDGQTPANPRNPYGLSKHVGEAQLAYIAKQYDIACRALRFPWLRPKFDMDELAKGNTGDSLTYRRKMAFAWLSYADTVRLIEAICEKPITGFGVYLPTAERNMLNQSAEQVIADHFPDVPIRREEGKPMKLVDCSAITAEVGWRPQD